MPLPFLFSDLNLIDQRKATSNYSDDMFAAALGTLPASANAKGSIVLSAEDGGTPFVGFYFGAKWCPPCRAFSPKLSQFAKENASNFSVVFVSADKSAEESMQFVKGKSFYVVPWKHQSSREQLMKHYNINSFPTLIVVDTRHHECKVVTRWGRMAISAETTKGALVKSWYAGKGAFYNTQSKWIGYGVVLLLMVVFIVFYKF